MVITDKKLYERYQAVKQDALAYQRTHGCSFLIKRIDVRNWVLIVGSALVLTCKRGNVRRFKSIDALANVLEIAGVSKANIDINTKIGV